MKRTETPFNSQIGRLNTSYKTFYNKVTVNSNSNDRDYNNDDENSDNNNYSTTTTQQK